MPDQSIYRSILVGLLFNVYIAALRSVLYSNVFTVILIVVTSFLARAFGSIAFSVTAIVPLFFRYTAIILCYTIDVPKVSGKYE